MAATPTSATTPRSASPIGVLNDRIRSISLLTGARCVVSTMIAMMRTVTGQARSPTTRTTDSFTYQA
jgi:hypothetical protein